MTEELKSAIWARVNEPGPEGDRARAAVLTAWSISVYETASLSEASKQLLTTLLLHFVHKGAGLTEDELAQAVREVCLSAEVALDRVVLN